MTPTEKHRETADDVYDNLARGHNLDGISRHDIVLAFAFALAKAEQEGMKRAAEIARDEAARSTNSVFIPVVANIVADRILSEASTSSQAGLDAPAKAGEACSPPSSPASPAPHSPWRSHGFNPDRVER